MKLTRISCPGCGSSSAAVINSWIPKPRPTERHRRLRCHDCAHRWTVARQKDEDWSQSGVTGRRRGPRPNARLTEAQVVEALTSPATCQVLAEQFGVSRAAVSAIRRRRVYRWIRPDLPAWTNPQRPRKPKPAPVSRAARQSCATCRWWDDERRKCRQGWPDPEIDGVRYGADCIDHELLKESP